MSLLILAIITATPRTLPAALASARSGDTIRLAEGSYRDVRIDRTFSPAVTIEATDTIVRGLRIAGGGVLWRGGTVSAPAGRNGFAAAGYAALVTGQNVTFSGTTFTNAKKAMVLDRAKGVTVMDSSFLRNGEDGIIASRTARLTVLRSRFALTMAKASSCTTVDGIVYRIARRDCLARAGVWADGYHPDAVQMRNGVTDVLLSGNVVEGMTQGLTQMGTTGDAPLARVRIEGNTVAADGHHITLANCSGCIIRNNVVRRWRRNTYKAVIRPGAARRCENQAQDEPDDGPCR